MDSFLDYLPEELLYIVSTYLGLKYLKTYESSDTLNSSLNKSYEKYFLDVNSGRIESFKMIKREDLKLYKFKSYKGTTLSIISNKLKSKTINNNESIRFINRHLDITPDNIIYVNISDFEYSGIHEYFTLIFVDDENEYNYIHKYHSSYGDTDYSISTKKWGEVYDQRSLPSILNIAHSRAMFKLDATAGIN